MNRRYDHRPVILSGSTDPPPANACQTDEKVYAGRRLRATLPLPLGFGAQVSIHPLLRCNDTSPSIIYNLNSLPETATISNGAHCNNIQDWFSEPALMPYEADSLTINIEGVDRPVVIVAATGLDPKGPFTGFITIWDVLHSCHLAWNDARQNKDFRGSLDGHSSRTPYASRFGGSLLFSCSEGIENNLTSAGYLMTPKGDLEDVCKAMRAGLVITDIPFNEHCFWAGLIPSVVEQEAWTMKVSNAECRK